MKPWIPRYFSFFYFVEDFLLPWGWLEIAFPNCQHAKEILLWRGIPFVVPSSDLSVFSLFIEYLQVSRLKDAMSKIDSQLQVILAVSSFCAFLIRPFRVLFCDNTILVPNLSFHLPPPLLSLKLRRSGSLHVVSVRLSVIVSSCWPIPSFTWPVE
jgi:hypothetical protein